MPITRPKVRQLAPEDERLTLSAPALVSAEMWEAVQADLVSMRARHGGNPKWMRMLSGLCFCPYCGERTRTKYQKANGKPYAYYCCARWSKACNFPGEHPCRGGLYSIAIVEQAALRALQEACQRPEAFAASLPVYRRSERKAAGVADPRR